SHRTGGRVVVTCGMHGSCCANSKGASVTSATRTMLLLESVARLTWQVRRCAGRSRALSASAARLCWDETAPEVTRNGTLMHESAHLHEAAASKLGLLLRHAGCSRVLTCVAASTPQTRPTAT